MIKSVNISEDNEKKFVTIDIECEPASGVKSIQVVCLPEKAKEAQELIYKVMQLLSIPQKFGNAAVQLGSLFSKSGVK